MDRVTTARALERPRYQFKVRPYSSHRLLIEEFRLRAKAAGYWTSDAHPGTWQKPSQPVVTL
jgi:hypothetical protein